MIQQLLIVFVAALLAGIVVGFIMYRR